MKTLYKHLSPARRIGLFFLSVILFGSTVLSLPVMQASSSQATYLDHLFTTVSMVCVTGLSTQPVANTYNTLGQVICMILMQVGGLGVLSFLGLFYIDVNKRFNYNDRTTLQESLNRDEALDFKVFLKAVFAFTFLFETIGMMLLSLRFVPMLGWGKGLFTSVFLAISAFCNAGFDNLGANSLQNYTSDPLINLTIAGLIITGGIGFSIWFDLLTQVKNRRNLKHLRFHTKVVLSFTLTILILGTLLSFLTEMNNPETIGRLGFGQKLLASFFQTVSMRTAGFATFDYTKAQPITLLIYVVQMMMGGAPGGTAGGIKITTLLVMVFFVKGQILGLPHTNFKKRTIHPDVVQKALAIFSVFIATFVASLLLLALLEPKINLLYLIFEAMSALATVGVSANLTSRLSQASLILVMGLMFVGRIGPITIITGLNRRKPSKKQMLQYAKADLFVG
ncbi:TrkH family potassium uptake protein [Streptococcus merionis]|uniref:Potassium uptake protein, TrkH family n=1 Tax=Streptococcus merionis TaxID=400065 RepID=A0A239SY22_9STRE|nr:potassium transporter TrkG [Streptococcus merionis]SNU89483.1 potassium uptake protein, TrkH family [Streptococcus merionis]